MAVKLANVFGARVVMFTTSAGKAEDAVRLGAHDVVVSRNAAEMQKHRGSFDFILDTVSAAHDVNAYLNLLKRDGTLTLVGAPETPMGGHLARRVARVTPGRRIRRPLRPRVHVASPF